MLVFLPEVEMYETRNRSNCGAGRSEGIADIDEHDGKKGSRECPDAEQGP